MHTKLPSCFTLYPLLLTLSPLPYPLSSSSMFFHPSHLSPLYSSPFHTISPRLYFLSLPLPLHPLSTHSFYPSLYSLPLLLPSTSSTSFFYRLPQPASLYPSPFTRLPLPHLFTHFPFLYPSSTSPFPLLYPSLYLSLYPSSLPLHFPLFSHSIVIKESTAANLLFFLG